MSKAHQKYVREQNILTDKQQLTIDNLKPMDNYLKPRLNLNYKQTVICPFCLCKGKLGSFLYSVKHGFHRSLGKCPECKQRTRFETLLLIPNMTSKEFARFIFDYGKEFWSKCIFEQFRNRLYLNKDFAKMFLEEYKRLEGDYYED